MKRVQIPRGIPEGPRTGEGEDRDHNNSLIFIQTHRLLYCSPPLHSCGGALVHPKPHRHRRTSNCTSNFYPCSSRLRSHRLFSGCAGHRWVKFTCLCKLVDITKKVRVFQKTQEDSTIMVCYLIQLATRYCRQLDIVLKTSLLVL